MIVECSICKTVSEEFIDITELVKNKWIGTSSVEHGESWYCPSHTTEEWMKYEL